MKILLLTQVLPYPPDSGPKIKTWNVLKYLVLHHEVTLVSFVRGNQDREVNFLRTLCQQVYTVPMERSALKDGQALLHSLVTGIPWVMARDRREAMIACVREITVGAQFDVIQADQLNMAQFALEAKGGLKVVDEHNALWLLYQRMAKTEPQGLKKWLFERDWRLLRSYEGQICNSFDRVIAVSEIDKLALAEVSDGTHEISVIPIAVDVDEVKPVARKAGSARIVHVGTMFWPPNVEGILWFAKEVFPLIKEKRPNVGFDIIGARPPEEVTRLGSEDPAIRVTGYVENIDEYLQEAGVLIVPVRAGGGMRVKILNQLSQELPMVTTQIGCEGIAVENGKHLLIADTPQAYAQAVLRILEDRPFADELGKAGRRLIQQKYDYRKVCAQLDEVYQPDFHQARG